MGWFTRTSESPQAPKGPTPGTVEALAASTRTLTTWLRSLGGSVPPRSMALARVIADHLDDVVRDPAASRLDVQTLVTLERTASAHVPDTINAYLAARQTPGAAQMLLDQLATIERVAADAAGRSIQAAADALEVQGTFLREKFGDA